jgi:branched-chain amino acid transport system substrate-binding protein
MEFKMFKFLIIAVSLMSSLALAKDGKKSEPLNIYVPGSYTGVVPFVAKDIYEAVKFFAEETNKQGGLLGRKIQVIKQDDQAKINQAQTNAMVALKDPNHLITVGHNFSSLALPIGKEYAQAGQLFFTPYATNSDISKIGKTVFQLCYNDEFQGKTLGNVAVKKLKAKRIAIITNQSDVYSKGLADQFMAQVKKLDKNSAAVQVKQVNFINSMLDVKKIVKEISDFKSDLIFLPENKMKAAELIRVFQESKIGHVAILGSDGWGSENANIGMYFEKAKNNKTPPYYYTYHWVSTIQNQRNQALLKKLTDARKGKVYGPGMLSYEGLLQLRKLIRQEKSTNPKLISKKLRGTSYEGSTGKVFFDPRGHTVRDLVLLKLGSGGLTIDSFVRPEQDMLTK